MITAIEFALMAGHAYRTTRDEINWLPVPQEWTPFFPVPDSTTAAIFPATDGFEAISFTRGTGTNTEIVISFAGTDPADITGDIAADVGLATGYGSAQLLQAAEYYLDVKRQNPDATLTLTGHSLGGGLAALVGVFFGVNAFTFDQAPFAKSAELSILHPDVAANLRAALAAVLDGNGNRVYDDTALTGLQRVSGSGLALMHNGVGYLLPHPTKVPPKRYIMNSGAEHRTCLQPKPGGATQDEYRT